MGYQTHVRSSHGVTYPTVLHLATASHEHGALYYSLYCSARNMLFKIQDANKNEIMYCTMDAHGTAQEPAMFAMHMALANRIH